MHVSQASEEGNDNKNNKHAGKCEESKETPAGAPMCTAATHALHTRTTPRHATPRAPAALSNTRRDIQGGAVHTGSPCSFLNPTD